MFCAACKQHGPLNFRVFRDSAAHRQHPTYVSDVLQLYKAILLLCFAIPGFHIDCVHYDWMHCFNLGVLQFVLGNILTELAEEGRFGRDRGEARVRMGLQLRRAWQTFKKLATNNGLQHSQPVFTPGSTSWPAWPVLKCKAANATRVLTWIADTLLREPGPGGRAILSRNVVVCWHRASEIVGRSPMYLSEAHALEFKRMNTSALLSYQLLAREACEAGRMRWQLKPKHHALDRISRRSLAERRNPRSLYCFNLEDMVGSVTRIAQRCHAARVSDRVLS